MECYTPAFEKQNGPSVNVHVTLGGDSISSATVFNVYDAARVTSLIPSSGFIDGGSVIQAQGTGFRSTGTVMCRFGEFESPFAEYLSSELVKCVTPKAVVGLFELQLSFDAINFFNTDFWFRFEKPPMITSVSPAVIKWGSVLTLFGTSFPHHRKILCKIGSGKPSNATRETDKKLL